MAWRTAFTVLSFALFGIGALALSLVLLPLIHLICWPRERARRCSRQAVRGGFRLLVWFMRATGVLDYRITGNVEVPPGSLIIANHPSLIDVVFIVAFVPDAHCVVKEALGKNPLTTLIMRMTGYPVAFQPDRLMDQCAALLESGARIVMFPEGTRTVAGSPPSFRRGAATLLYRARCPVVPVFVAITPATLAKGEPWFRVPPRQVLFRLVVGDPVPPAQLMEAGPPTREAIRRCTARLEKIYTDRLSNKMVEVSQTGAFGDERPAFEPPADP